MSGLLQFFGSLTIILILSFYDGVGKKTSKISIHKIILSVNNFSIFMENKI